jgi:hypothetical protein
MKGMEQLSEVGGMGIVVRVVVVAVRRMAGGQCY